MADSGPQESSPTPIKPPRERFRTRGYVADFGAGRTCAAPRCETMLSRYNSGRLCWVHEKHTRSRENTADS